jgi:hypothetical protein
MSLVKKLADKHESDVHEWMGGHQARSSGNQWADQGDGHTSRYEQLFSFAWDCKCAMPQTKSISVTREMVDKITAQAHGERIALPFRFYDSERGGIEHDLIVLKMADFLEMMETIDELLAKSDEKETGDYE